MRRCMDCGAAFPDSFRFCGECGKAFESVEPSGVAPVSDHVPASVGGPAPSRMKLNPSAMAKLVLSGRGSVDLKAFERKRQADIVFVLDCTGSMKGEIEAIKTTIAEFADTIAYDGVRARIGLVEYRDHYPPMNEETIVHLFEHQGPFTSSALVFRQVIEPLRATGGGPEPESTLDALMTALALPFREDASKVMVLITDAPPYIPDRDTQTVEEVLDKITEVGLNQIYVVTRLADPRCHVYLRLIERCRGLAFELGKGDDFRTRAEDFKKTLLSLGKTISSATR